MAETFTCVGRRVDWSYEKLTLPQLGDNEKASKATQGYLSQYLRASDNRLENNIVCIPMLGVTSSSMCALMAGSNNNVSLHKGEIAHREGMLEESPWGHPSASLSVPMLLRTR